MNVLCAAMKDGDVLLAHKAYVDLAVLYNLGERGIFFVLRAKDSIAFDIVEVDAQFFAPRRNRQVRPLDEDRPPQNPADLWDSRRSQEACDCRKAAIFKRI
jgi:hypothetical protein